ncbi:MAG: protein kinase domain-containing protein [Thermoplasmatota archaeon]
MKSYIPLALVILIFTNAFWMEEGDYYASESEEGTRGFIDTPVQNFNLTFNPPMFYNDRYNTNTWDHVAFVVLVRENTTSMKRANDNQSNTLMTAQEIHQSLFVPLDLVVHQTRSKRTAVLESVVSSQMPYDSSVLESMRAMRANFSWPTYYLGVQYHGHGDFLNALGSQLYNYWNCTGFPSWNVDGKDPHVGGHPNPYYWPFQQNIRNRISAGQTTSRVKITASAGHGKYPLGSCWINVTVQILDQAFTDIPLKMEIIQVQDASNWMNYDNITLGWIAQNQYNRTLFEGKWRDDDPPVISNDRTPRTPTTGEQLRMMVDIKDDTEVYKARAVYRFGEGAVQNVSMTGNGNYTHTVQIPSDSIEPFRYRFIAYDRYGHMSSTTERTLIVKDNDPPVLLNDTTPSRAAAGEQLTFEVQIRDNIGVENAFVEYRFDDGKYINGSMKGNTTYTYQITVPQDGSSILQYIIEAVDESGNWMAAEVRNITLSGTDAPLLPTFVRDLTPTKAAKGDELILKVVVESPVGVQGVSLEYWFELSAHQNVSMELTSNNTYSYVLQVPGEVSSMRYFFSAVDNNGAWNRTEPKTVSFIDTVDSEPPIFEKDPTPRMALAGSQFTFEVHTIDDSGVQWVTVEYWIGNLTPMNVTMTGDGTYTLTINIPSDIDAVLHYRFHAVDTLGNWAHSVVKDVLIKSAVDLENPAFGEDRSGVSGRTGEPFLFSINVTDDTGISIVMMEYWFEGGSHTNISLTAEGDSYWYEMIIPNVGNTTLHYIFHARDISGKLSSTEMKTVLITIPMVHPDDDDVEPDDDDDIAPDDDDIKDDDDTKERSGLTTYLIIGSIIPIIILVIVLIVLLLRKKTKEEEENEEEEELEWGEGEEDEEEEEEPPEEEDMVEHKAPEPGGDVEAEPPEVMDSMVHDLLDDATVVVEKGGHLRIMETARAKKKVVVTSDQVPGFDIIKRIGKGGFSEVFKAKDETGKKVALKIPSSALFEESAEKQRDRFLHEAKNWENLCKEMEDHPGIVKIHSYGLEPMPYISMEYMQRGTLRSVIEELGEEEKIEILCSILETLHNVHHMGVIHRDIKPENIMLNNKGQWKITDWGLSKLLLSSSGSTTKAGNIKATLAYAAPEQIDPDSFGKVDWRTDIYQVGVLAYEMLTGARPFEGEPSRIIFSVVSRRPMGPRAVNKDIPEHISKTIMVALEKKKKDRWQSAMEFKKALEGK